MAKIKKIKDKLGAPRKDKKNKNPYLKNDGSFDLIDEVVGIDFMPYEKRRIKKSKKR